MTWSVERKIAVGFVLAFSGLLTLGSLSYREMSDLIDADQWVSHTHEVLTGLADISLAMTRAGSSQRGYLVSHDSDFLQAYSAAAESARERIHHVALMTSDNPVQIENFKLLRPIVAQRLDALTAILDQDKNKAPGTSVSSIGIGEDEKRMGDVRAQLERMKDEEYRLLALRNARSRRLAGGTFLLFTLGAVLELSLLGVVYGLMRRDLNLRRRGELEQRDVSDRLRRAAEQLSRSNRELQDFASVASHDLQEPLRKIQAFGDRLRIKCAPLLTSDGLDYLGRMQNAANRMQTLINDLLSFSRIATKAQPFIQVSLEQVVREVLIDLEVRVEQLKGKVEVGPLPMVYADPLQMRQLMQNLIGNALKFHKQGEPPLVRVRHTGTFPAPGGQEQVEVAVQDNGIGFDIKYLDRIFTVFQRLHGRSDYEGTGVGLAVCRKIVERHGGSVTAQSEVGAGSTFLVRLPTGPAPSDDADTGGSTAIQAPDPARRPAESLTSA